MALTRRDLLAAAGTGLATAGCLGSGTGGQQTDRGSSTIRVLHHGQYGPYLVDTDGMTLYRFDADTPGAGRSACTGGCLDAWPPLTVEGEPTAGEDVTAPLSTFEREDGGTQVAADGWPLYYYASDTGAGEVEGQAVGDAWWLVAPDGSPVTQTPRPGGQY